MDATENPAWAAIANLPPVSREALLRVHQAAIDAGQTAAPAAPAPLAPIKPPQQAAPPIGAPPEAPKASDVAPGGRSTRPILANAAPGPAGMPSNPYPSAPDTSALPATSRADSPMVGLPSPTVRSPLQQRLAANENRLDHLEDTGSGVSQIHSKIEHAMPNHPTLGKVLGWGAEIPARIADIAGSSVAPGLAANIPGTEMHHRLLLNQAGKQVAAGEESAQREAATAHEQEATAEMPGREQSEEDLRKSQAAALQTTPLTAEEAKAAGNELLEGIPVTAAQRAGLLKQGGINTTKKDIQADKPEKTPNDFEQYYHDFLTENKFPDTAHNRLLAREHYAAAGQAPQKPQQQLAVIDGKVVELKPGMAVPKGTESLGGDLKGSKPSLDETRRADLANNMNENLNQLEDILHRRPELFGPAAGRMTELKSKIGTDDPDIAALKGIHEWFGMASVGAHAMRNAQHVVQAADAVFNGYHNYPKAVEGAIKAARASVATFQQDVGEKPGSTSKTGGRQGGGEKKWNPVTGVYE